MIIHNAKLKFSQEQTERERTDYIVIHHSAGNDESVQEIHRSHQNFGWIGIGYNYYIKKNGEIWQGRNENAVGAHTEKYNSVSVGVCVAGNFEYEEPTVQQLQALHEVIDRLKARYPNAKIVGHRDLNATACPGKNLFKKINETSVKKNELKIKIYAHDKKVGISVGGKSYNIDTASVPDEVIDALMRKGEITIKMQEK